MVGRKQARVDEIRLAIGTEFEVCVTEPLDVIAGYAFAEHEPRRGRRGSAAYGEDPPTTRSRWGYRTFDCIPTAPGPELSGVDLTVAAGLNARLNVDRVGALQAASAEVGRALEHLDGAPPFWELDRGELAAPSGDSRPEWWLTRAWYVLMRQPQVGVAVTHKALHHKRPLLFPLLDGVTRKRLPAGQAWVTIHDDLTTQAEAWGHLEMRFAGLIDTDRGDVQLGRLRLHDILLWLTAIGHAEQARREGMAWRQARPG